MHTLPDNFRVLTLGTPGLVTNGDAFGVASYVDCGQAEYTTFLLAGTGSAAANGTLNVFQGTTSAGAAAKVVSGASLNFGTSGTAWAITVKSDQTDTANGFKFLTAYGTTPSSGSYWVGLTAIQTSMRVRPGTHGLTGSVYVVS